MASSKLTLLALGAVLASTAACSVQTTDHGPRTGFLTVQWSIAGTFSSVACADFAVASVEVLAIDSGGSVASQRTVACESHSVELELYPGTYELDVTMLDSRAAARTTTLHLPVTRVISDTNVTLDTDFPSASFY